MPFRERVKRVLNRNSGSDGSSLKTSKTNDSIYYAPGEMPKPRFRGPVDPAHKALMESFSFKDSWGRRNSAHSQCSPFASKIHTRSNSIDGGSREPWALHIDSRKRHGPSAMATSGAAHVENVDDETVNVSESRAASIPEPPSSVPSDTSIESNDSDDNTLAGRHFKDHKPFTEADFNNALKKSLSKSRGQD